jgi:hypothetical protein
MECITSLRGGGREEGDMKRGYEGMKKCHLFYKIRHCLEEIPGEQKR